MGDGSGVLGNGTHIRLRGAAGWRDSQWGHHHPWFELQEKTFLQGYLFQAYNLFTKSCWGGGGVWSLQKDVVYVLQMLNFLCIHG